MSIYLQILISVISGLVGSVFLDVINLINVYLSILNKNTYYYSCFGKIYNTQHKIGIKEFRKLACKYKNISYDGISIYNYCDFTYDHKNAHPNKYNQNWNDSERILSVPTKKYEEIINALENCRKQKHTIDFGEVINDGIICECNKLNFRDIYVPEDKSHIDIFYSR